MPLHANSPEMPFRWEEHVEVFTRYLGYAVEELRAHDQAFLQICHSLEPFAFDDCAMAQPLAGGKHTPPPI